MQPYKIFPQSHLTLHSFVWRWLGCIIDMKDQCGIDVIKLVVRFGPDNGDFADGLIVELSFASENTRKQLRSTNLLFVSTSIKLNHTSDIYTNESITLIRRSRKAYSRPFT